MAQALLSVALAAGVVLHSTPAAAQAVSADGNFDAVVNGAFDLCLKLVDATAQFPNESVAYNYGFKPAKSSNANQRWLESRFTDGLVQLRFDENAKVCTVHNGGGGYQSIAGMARDVVTSQFGYKLLIDDSKDGATGKVYVKLSEDGLSRRQFTIVETPKTKTTSISFTKKANR